MGTYALGELETVLDELTLRAEVAVEGLEYTVCSPRLWNTYYPL